MPDHQTAHMGIRALPRIPAPHGAFGGGSTGPEPPGVRSVFPPRSVTQPPTRDRGELMTVVIGFNRPGKASEVGS